MLVCQLLVLLIAMKCSYLSQISSMAVLLTQSWSRLSLEPGNWPRVSHSTSNLFPPTLRKMVLSGSRGSLKLYGMEEGENPGPPISRLLGQDDCQSRGNSFNF